ncbi:MAG TPA: DUF3037 domain-containing protein [Euzebyales bacterium]|nr:DUF3037 domain-containing protein [Euzebyales bacterium]
MSRMPFEYAVLRAVPRVDRGERINVGVIMYCQQADYLDTRWRLDGDRLRFLDPDVDTAAVEATLAAIDATCAGQAAAGPAGQLPRSRRFRWLTAPRSTVVQPGPVHAGLTSDPAAELARLFDQLVGP